MGNKGDFFFSIKGKCSILSVAWLLVPDGISQSAQLLGFSHTTIS